MLYEFNAKLASGEFVLTARQRVGVAEWERELAGQVALHKKMAAGTHTWFPELAGVTAATRDEVVAQAKCRVLDDKFVRLRYGSIRRKSYPRKDLLDWRWAHFRWMQVHMLSALEYIRRYGIAQDAISSKRIENDVVDMQYQVMALLAGRIATRDQAMRDAVLTLDRNAEVFS
jgi:hypothetical protein